MFGPAGKSRCFLPDLKPGYNPIRMHGLIARAEDFGGEGGFKRCLKKTCWLESGSW
jgi:hypothetical protein